MIVAIGAVDVEPDALPTVHRRETSAPGRRTAPGQARNAGTHSTAQEAVLVGEALRVADGTLLTHGEEALVELALDRGEPGLHRRGTAGVGAGGAEQGQALGGELLDRRAGSSCRRTGRSCISLHYDRAAEYVHRRGSRGSSGP